MRQPIEVIGVPFALGGSKLGPANGPAALIARGLMSHLSKLSLGVRYIDTKEASPSSNIFSSAPVHSLPTYSENAVREVTRLAGAHVFAAHRLGRLPVVIGGDHSVSLGTLPQFLYPAFSYQRKVGLLWLDAHYDAHTPKTSHSHYANGFPFASALGHGNPSLGWYRNTRTSKKKIRMRFLPQHTLHIGAGGSDCEPEEVALLTKLGVKTVTMADMSRTSMGVCMKKLATFLASVDDVICTFDLDVMHRDFVPGVSFQSQSGLLPYQALVIAEEVAHSGKLRQIEIMEYNPDFEEYTTTDSPKTVDFVFRLLEQLLRQSK